jgi:hypothetical protein
MHDNIVTNSRESNGTLPDPRASKDEHAACGTTTRHEALIFGPARASPGPVASGPGLAQPGTQGRAWAAPQARGLARHSCRVEMAD